jgi:site-specific recombinase XerD
MESFENYLIKNGYVNKSIQRAESVAAHYQHWVKEQQLNINTVIYNDLMNYVGHLQKQGSSKSKINEYLRNIRLYYEYLKIPNIAFGVVIRGEEKNTMPLLNDEELEKIYNHFESKSKKGYWRYSDKIILGFIVYQCLDTKDIYRIELKDLDLTKGTIYIPAGVKRKASRTLKLEAHQIVPLYEYISNHRAKEVTQKLLSPQCTCLGRLQGQLKDLFKQVNTQTEEININLIRFSQIRQSRITIWIRQHGLRKTQYLGGYKRVDNVERYRQQDVEDLRESIKKYHPLQ